MRCHTPMNDINIYNNNTGTFLFNLKTDLVIEILIILAHL